jgi:hypothetical protein
MMRTAPARFMAALLVIEALLGFSDRFGWWHKGYAVLTGLAVVGVATLLLLAWFGVALAFRRRFQISLRTLLALVLIVALPCSWLAVEAEKARRQMEAVGWVAGARRWVRYDYEFAKTPAAKHAWLETVLGKDFFFSVVDADLCNTDESIISVPMALPWYFSGRAVAFYAPTVVANHTYPSARSRYGQKTPLAAPCPSFANKAASPGKYTVGRPTGLCSKHLARRTTWPSSLLVPRMFSAPLRKSAQPTVSPPTEYRDDLEMGRCPLSAHRLLAYHQVGASRGNAR